MADIIRAIRTHNLCTIERKVSYNITSQIYYYLEIEYRGGFYLGYPCLQEVQAFNIVVVAPIREI